MIPQEAVSLGYHSHVRRVGVAVLFLSLVAVPGLEAQIHGVPPSVTSFGPGRGPSPGVPASVTSLEPNGFEGGNPAIVLPNRVHFRRHRHHPFVAYYPVPAYTPYYYSDVVPGPVDDSMEEEDSGGPTLFDRRGPGTNNGFVTRRYARDEGNDGAQVSNNSSSDRNSFKESPGSEATKDSAADSEGAASASDQSSATVLVFKDGRKAEVKNYAILGDVLYDLTPGHPRKIPLSDLDLEATQKVNEDLGTSFQLPTHVSGS